MNLIYGFTDYSDHSQYTCDCGHSISKFFKILVWDKNFNMLGFENTLLMNETSFPNNIEELVKLMTSAHIRHSSKCTQATEYKQVLLQLYELDLLRMLRNIRA